MPEMNNIYSFCLTLLNSTSTREHGDSHFNVGGNLVESQYYPSNKYLLFPTTPPSPLDAVVPPS